MHLRGKPVLVSKLAVETSTTFNVQKHPIKKRRRNWRVVKVLTTKPAMLSTPTSLIVHPVIYEQLKAQHGKVA